jgi:hypothetical protein
MTRKQNSTTGKHHRQAGQKSSPTSRRVTESFLIRLWRIGLWQFRIAASSKWLMGDPPYEPKARGINELPMRFDPERALVRCRGATHALEPGN